MAAVMPRELTEYIETRILPGYTRFDSAHNIEHAQRVLANSMAIAEDYDVNMAMVYVIAAYHDVGLIDGRDGHEKASAALLLADDALKQWFADDELSVMAQAVEDHRASNDCEPRSLYGKIIAEADRDIDYATILKRTVQYSLEHFPRYNFEQHFERTISHLNEKYGENGYLKCWLNTAQNMRQLAELRNNIADGVKISADFQSVYDALTNQASSAAKPA